MSDLQRLPAAVSDAVIVLDNGEVMRRFEQATRAIDDLSNAGFKVLGLDARNSRDDGPTGIPLSDSSGLSLEAARKYSHDALARAERITQWAGPHI